MTSVNVACGRDSSCSHNLTPPDRFSLAGNLREYQMQCHDGVVRAGGVAKAHGLPLAYGGLPHENVAFVGCHDNLTTFDQARYRPCIHLPALYR